MQRANVGSRFYRGENEVARHVSKSIQNTLTDKEKVRLYQELMRDRDTKFANWSACEAFFTKVMERVINRNNITSALNALDKSVDDIIEGHEGRKGVSNNILKGKIAEIESKIDSILLRLHTVETRLDEFFN